MESVVRVYLVLGARGSGRLPIIAHLMAEGFEPDTRFVLACGDTDARQRALAHAIASQDHVQLVEASIQARRYEMESWEGQADYLILLSDGTNNPVDEVEAFKAWLHTAPVPVELARILTVVDCGLMNRHAEAVAWYDACAHFSDVLLLAHREEVPQKWLNDYVARFTREKYPCLVEHVKKDGKVDNAARVMAMEPRRMSLVFEPPLEEELVDAETMLMDGEDEGLPIEESDDDEEEPEVPETDPSQDRYLATHPTGQRIQSVPEIAPILERDKRP